MQIKAVDAAFLIINHIHVGASSTIPGWIDSFSIRNAVVLLLFCTDTDTHINSSKKSRKLESAPSPGSKNLTAAL